MGLSAVQRRRVPGHEITLVVAIRLHLPTVHARGLADRYLQPLRLNPIGKPDLT